MTASGSDVTCAAEALPRARRLPRPARWFALLSLVTPLMLAGCASGPEREQEGASSGQPTEADASRDALAELVHRYVLTSPLLDECLDDWGDGGEQGVSIDFLAMPSGALELLEVSGGEDGMRACVDDALGRIRLPGGSVEAAKKVNVSIR